jgi:catechol 2,3-dioxygenase-like lactoylglutathione lyase family enzyme
MQLDHVTIVAPDCEGMRRFFVDVAGMTEGPRPPFGISGYWLYLDGRAVIHLIGSGAKSESSTNGRLCTRIDHLALRVQTGEEWQALLDRLSANRIPYQTGDVPISRERQLFVQLGTSVVVEFVTAMPRG